MVDVDTLAANVEQHHRPGAHLTDICVLCWAPWPCMPVKLASAFTEARAELTEAIKKRDNWHAVAKDICDEWSEANGAVCDPTCSSFGHTETCKATNIADYLKALRQERDAMQAELTALRQDANDAAVALAKVTTEREQWEAVAEWMKLGHGVSWSRWRGWQAFDRRAAWMDPGIVAEAPDLPALGRALLDRTDLMVQTPAEQLDAFIGQLSRRGWILTGRTERFFVYRAPLDFNEDEYRLYVPRDPEAPAFERALGVSRDAFASFYPSPSPAPPDEWSTMDAITGPLPTDNA